MGQARYRPLASLDSSLFYDDYVTVFECRVQP